ncbi:MAG: methyltransferase domain-containing protein [Proteobacteria bacterium]|jgi:SAM-dependent methyltransferase|nr:methyltransferase domain-containing protein [Pseudomonadota bacterium]
MARSPAPPSAVSAPGTATERELAVYDQNSQTLRSLNQLFWQIPVISMSLTGGLWFGVAKAEASPWFQLGLLGLAGVGNVVLVLILHRLRYVMDEYLSWLRQFDTSGFVAAPGKGWLDKPYSVRTALQTMFSLAAAFSFAMMVPSVLDVAKPRTAKARTLAFYDRAAEDLVDRYEALDFGQAHPHLAAKLSGAAPLNILDVGAGSGRDAAAMASLGHHVWAAEPSDRMRGLGRALHGAEEIQWLDASMPKLQAQGLTGRRFDLIVLSAVWMHVPVEDRREALERLSALLTQGGEIYLTLRLGPGDAGRAMYPVTSDELGRLAPLAGLEQRVLGDKPDLLGRKDISWRTVVLTKPAPVSH